MSSDNLLFIHMQTSKIAENKRLTLTLPEQPLQNSMIQLGSSSLTFSPRKKVSLQEDLQFEDLRKSLISSPSNLPNTGKDLTKSQVTFNFSPRNLTRANGSNGVSGDLASPTNKEFWSPKQAKTLNTNPESNEEKGEKANASWSLKKGNSQKTQIVNEVV